MLVMGDESSPGAGAAGAALEPEHGIKCRYMRAAHGYLSNTTFHGISWVLTDVSRATKVFT